MSQMGHFTSEIDVLPCPLLGAKRNSYRQVQVDASDP